MSTIDTFVAPSSGSLGRNTGRATHVRRIVYLAVGLIDRMLERRRSRLALLEMSDDQLKDIGISRSDAFREGLRPFWD